MTYQSSPLAQKQSHLTVHWQCPQPMQAEASQALPADMLQWGPPLVLLAKAQLMLLLTAGDAELAGSGAPLPPLELYNPARSTAGVVPMLCCALWRALWTDAAYGAG